jgi:hypothetical protein
VEVKVHRRGLSILASAAWVVGTGALGATSLRASTTFVNATNSGFFSNTGQHISGQTEYEIGDTETSAVLRDFTTFTLPTPGLGQQFVSATLTVTTATVSTSDPSETATFFDVSTSAGTLNTGFSSGSATGQAAYDDLGSGAVFGSQVYFPSDPPAGTKTITLDSAAISAMNVAAGSSFSIGGAVTTLDAVDNIELIYAGSNGPAFQLALTTGPVPEPGSTLALGMFAAAFAARRGRPRPAGSNRTPPGKTLPLGLLTPLPPERFRRTERFDPTE